MSVRTGFIGVGAMGSPMALNILKAGIPLVVHDVDENKTIEHEKAGAEVLYSPMEDSKLLLCVVQIDQLNIHFVSSGQNYGPEGLSRLLEVDLIRLKKTRHPLHQYN